MSENKELKLAHDKLNELSNDEHMQKLAEWRQKAIWDENTNRKASFDERSSRTVCLNGHEERYTANCY